MFKNFLKKYISSINAKVPWYVFLGVALLSIPVLKMGKSIRFYFAFLSLQYLVIAVYVFIKFIREKNWKFSIASISICLVLFLSSGTLFGIAAKILLYLFVVLFVVYLVLKIIERFFSLPIINNTNTSENNDFLILLIVVVCAIYLLNDHQKGKNDVGQIKLLPQASAYFS